MQSRTESLLVAIRDRIRTAQIAPGEVIAENQFTEEFGVSRTPVRETFRLLTTEGWLQVLPRKGYLVRPLNLTDIREVMDMRIILEPELAARAAIAPARRRSPRSRRSSRTSISPASALPSRLSSRPSSTSRWRC